MITQEYKGEVIVYDEFSDSWGCAHTSNARTRKSLADCKAAIDKAQVAEAEFKRVEALKSTYGETFKVVTVTSKADDKNYWISDRGRRSKEGADTLFEASEHNNQIIEKIKGLIAQERDLSKQRDALRKELIPFKEA